MEYQVDRNEHFRHYFQARQHCVLCGGSRRVFFCFPPIGCETTSPGANIGEVKNGAAAVGANIDQERQTSFFSTIKMPSVFKNALALIFGNNASQRNSTQTLPCEEHHCEKSIHLHHKINGASSSHSSSIAVSSSAVGTSTMNNGGNTVTAIEPISGGDSIFTSMANATSPRNHKKHKNGNIIGAKRSPIQSLASPGGAKIPYDSPSISSLTTANFDHNSLSDQRVPAYMYPDNNAEGVDARARSLDSAQIAIWEPTPIEKELVKRTWSDDFDFLYELGASIYSYIFENNPHTIKLFPAIHQHGERYKESREFRSQALKFVQTIAHAVKNLYHMDSLAPYLYRIGERHVKFAERGFKPEFWNIFLDAMEQSIIGHIKSLKDFSANQQIEAVQVWRRLAFYIITHMKHGYFDRLEAVRTGRASLC